MTSTQWKKKSHEKCINLGKNISLFLKAMKFQLGGFISTGNKMVIKDRYLSCPLMPLVPVYFWVVSAPYIMGFPKVSFLSHFSFSLTLSQRSMFLVSSTVTSMLIISDHYLQIHCFMSQWDCPLDNLNSVYPKRQAAHRHCTRVSYPALPILFNDLEVS